MTAPQYVDFDDDIRAVPLDRLAPDPARVLPFTPRLELTDLQKWERLCARDPRSAAMIQTAFRELYAMNFPDDEP